MRRALAVTLATFAALFVLAVVRYSPPPPRDAAPADFSAHRAREVQRAIATAPRPAGSEAIARARAHLAGLLASRGYAVEEQHGFACGRWGTCAFVTNLVARLPGDDPHADALLLTAHLDSVPAAPGASDDGMGTATIAEVARAIAEGPRPKRSLVVLFTDAEEDGLLGAELFARDPEHTKGIKAAINVDARGSGGPSAMFEATPDNAWLVALMDAHLPRPVTSSVFYEVYKRMPNDTDFTAVKRFASGVNFANVARIEHYHTGQDTTENADLGTLQHHGDHVLAMARAFDGANISEPHHGDAVWFDVMSMFLVRWPAPASLPFATVALVLVVTQVLRGRLWDRGLLAFLAALLASLAAAGAVTALLSFSGAIAAPWVAHPGFALVALHGLAFAAALRVLLLVKGSPGAVWAGTWLVIGAAGVALAATVPGACYLFVIPAFVAGVIGWSPLRAAIAAGAAFVVLLPIAVQIHDALGFAVPIAPIFFSLLMLCVAAPVMSAIDRRVPLACAVLGAMGLLASVVVPKFSVKHPQRVNVVFRQDEAGARVHVDTSWGMKRWGAPPSAMIDALGAAHACDAVAFFGLPTTCADMPKLDLPPPVLEDATITKQGEDLLLRGRVRSPRGAPRILVELPKERRCTLRVEGELAQPYAGLVDLRAVPAEGVAIALECVGDALLELTLHDRSFGVPEGLAAAVAAARPREASPFQEGDVTIVSHPVLGPGLPVPGAAY